METELVLIKELVQKKMKIIEMELDCISMSSSIEQDNLWTDGKGTR